MKNYQTRRIIKKKHENQLLHLVSLLILGSLISLLRRIHSIHRVIMEAIETTNEASNSTTEPIIIPAQQLAAIKSTSKEVNYF